MKLLALAMTFLFSATLFAQSPATEAVERLLTAGTYDGSNGSERCSVTIQATQDSVTIAITNKTKKDSFTLINASSSYKVNDNTGAVSAILSLNYPRYINGGTKILNIVPDNIDQVEFSLAQLLEDHQGNDMSTYASCSVAK